MRAEGGRSRHGEGDDEADDAERDAEGLAAADDTPALVACHEDEEQQAHDGAGDQQAGERQGDLHGLAGVLDVETEVLEQPQRGLETEDDEAAGKHAGEPLEDAVGDRGSAEVRADDRDGEQDGAKQGAGAEAGQRAAQARPARAAGGLPTRVCA